MAYEPYHLFASRLNDWRYPATRARVPFPRLGGLPNIHRVPFVLNNGTSDSFNRYDVILFWHGMYGTDNKNKLIERATAMLTEGGLVVVFHRDGTLDFDGLVCHRTVPIPTGVVKVPDEDKIIDQFVSFIAGFNMDEDDALRLELREVCRSLARREDTLRWTLVFSAPDVIVTFNSHSASLSELKANVPMANRDRYETIKNSEARSHLPTPIARPTEIMHIQMCVKWALKHGVGLTVIGGGHSGHCLWPNVVAVDMAAFDKVHILTAKDVEDALIVAEAGCKTGDIISEAMQASLTVPLGARPSIGSGLWLQGGIGHLARLHGLACDAIVGAVLVSVECGDVFYVGQVPNLHRPAGAVRPVNEADLLWAIKGAGTKFGIVVSVTFKAYVAPMFLVRDWVLPLKGDEEARLILEDFDRQITRELSRKSSVDVYMYWGVGELHFGVTMFEASTTLTFTEPDYSTANIAEFDSKIVNAVELFDTEMYMSRLHGGHGHGKTSSFKRCLFLKNIGDPNVSKRLIAAVKSRPTSLCYLHLLHGGGAVADVAADATAFGCRDWDFACVVTGIWPRDQDDTEIARAVVRWVYSVVEDLWAWSRGAYGTDLGSDPRDISLAAKAFGGNLPRLKHLKSSLDPHNVLACACPILKASLGPKLIFLVTGKSGAGKDYCANIWVSIFKSSSTRLKVRAVSISDATKREYAASTGADLGLLLSDRAYKESHRAVLSAFYQQQTQQQPQLPVEHFQNVVYENSDADVLFITGTRDEAPVATFSHLAPESRLVDIHVQISGQLRRIHRGFHGHEDGRNVSDSENSDLEYRPIFFFHNDMTGDTAAQKFGKRYLLPYIHNDIVELADMVPRVVDFPRPGTEFFDVLGISNRPGGLKLTTPLLKSHFTGDWCKVDVVVTCETGGIVFASPLALQTNIPLVIIRDAGKLPSPTLSITKSSSYISSLAAVDLKEKRIEMERYAIPPSASVVVVDDVLSTGNTLCAVLQLLKKAGVSAENISVMIIAEFPFHRGREYLRHRGFGKVGIQSLLIFGGA